MKDPESARIVALTAEAQIVREDRTIDRVTKAQRLGDLQSEIARLTEMRRTDHAQKTNRMTALEQRLRRW